MLSKPLLAFQPPRQVLVSVAAFIGVCWQVAPEWLALGTRRSGKWHPIGWHLSAIASMIRGNSHSIE
ncbi:MAG: hypothetical protein ACOYJG_08095 [Prevotella sp.]